MDFNQLTSFTFLHDTVVQFPWIYRTRTIEQNVVGHGVMKIRVPLYLWTGTPYMKNLQVPIDEWQIYEGPDGVPLMKWIGEGSQVKTYGRKFTAGDTIDVSPALAERLALFNDPTPYTIKVNPDGSVTRTPKQ